MRIIQNAGKSTSIRTLNPAETFIINAAGKDLPFKGWKKKYVKFNPKENPGGNFYNTGEPEKISKLLSLIDDKMPNIKNIVLDDIGMVLAFQQFARAGEKGWDELYLSLSI